MSGARIKDIRKELQTLHGKYDIENLVIHSGSNNLPYDHPDSVIKQSTTLISEIRQHIPNTKLFVSALLPKMDKNISTDISYINNEIRKYCYNQEISFITHDTFSLRNNEINYDMIRPDRVHPTKAGTGRLAGNIISEYRKFNRRESYYNFKQSHSQ